MHFQAAAALACLQWLLRALSFSHSVCSRLLLSCWDVDPHTIPCRRKGPLAFIWDRTLRLVLPCIFYSFLAPPFILMWNEMAKNPNGNALTAWGNAYRGWLKPGWPTTYVLPTGPVS